MVAAVRSSYPSPDPSRSRRSRVRPSGQFSAARGSAVPASPPLTVVSRATTPKVRSLSSALALPWWLRTLCILQRGSSMVTLLLGVVVLSCYGALVYSQHRWSQTYHTLQDLRNREYQLTAAQESLRQGISSSTPAEAVPTWPSPEAIVFLEPTDIRPDLEADLPNSPHFIQAAFPLGY